MIYVLSLLKLEKTERTSLSMFWNFNESHVFFHVIKSKNKIKFNQKIPKSIIFQIVPQTQNRKIPYTQITPQH